MRAPNLMHPIYAFQHCKNDSALIFVTIRKGEESACVGLSPARQELCTIYHAVKTPAIKLSDKKPSGGPARRYGSQLDKSGPEQRDGLKDQRKY